MDASWDDVLGHCYLGLDLALFENQLFQNMVMLDIKLKGMKCMTTDKQKTGRLVMHIPWSSIPWVGLGEVFFNLVGDSWFA